MKTLEQRFDDAMFSIYKRAQEEVGYKPSLFLQMLHKDRGLLTAKKLINSAAVSEGYLKLNDAKRLDLTVEAVVVDNPEWHSLFTAEEIQRARRRLRNYNYLFGSS